MNHPGPGYVTPFILSGTFAIVAAVLHGLHRALGGWPEKDRKRAFSIGAALILLWLFAALLPSWLGFYGGPPSRIPTIQFGILLPIIAGVLLFSLSSSVRRVVDALPQEWMIGIQL